MLDTNVISEPVKPFPDPHVIAKLAAHESEFAIPSVVLHEICFGIERLTDSRRRRRLEAYLYDVILPTIPILPHDQNAALWHAKERVRLFSLGCPSPFFDTQIASIAVVNQLILVTRKIHDFSSFHHLVLENWFVSSFSSE